MWASHSAMRDSSGLRSPHTFSIWHTKAHVSCRKTERQKRCASSVLGQALLEDAFKDDCNSRNSASPMRGSSWHFHSFQFSPLSQEHVSQACWMDIRAARSCFMACCNTDDIPKPSHISCLRIDFFLPASATLEIARIVPASFETIKSCRLAAACILANSSRCAFFRA